MKSPARDEIGAGGVPSVERLALGAAVAVVVEISKSGLRWQFDTISSPLTAPLSREDRSPHLIRQRSSSFSSLRERQEERATIYYVHF